MAAIDGDSIGKPRDLPTAAIKPIPQLFFGVSFFHDLSVTQTELLCKQTFLLRLIFVAAKVHDNNNAEKD
jgi:hypothetical protein